jgi:hypothetical protein
MKTRQIRATEAQERQEEHNKLSKEQKIAKAESRRGDSRKEITRLKSA